jgi:hypothetical protein
MVTAVDTDTRDRVEPSSHNAGAITRPPPKTERTLMYKSVLKMVAMITASCLKGSRVFASSVGIALALVNTDSTTSPTSSALCRYAK